MKVMFYLRRAKFLSSILAALLFIIFAQQVGARSADDDGVLADLPLGGELRVENPRGSVSVEVWNESYVTVSATVRGERPKGSPVSISRTEQLLTVSVSPQRIGMLTRVDLSLRIPERSRAEIIATTGGIKIQGLPAELTARAGAGDIRTEFPPPLDADIQADAPNGKVTHAFASLVGFNDGFAKNDRHALHLRLGNGSSPVRLRSERGNITLAPGIQVANTIEANEKSRTPVLIGADKPGAGAGTPSTPLT